MKLLITQKNQIFDTIERIGLAPSQFELSEDYSKVSRGQIATLLKYKGTDFYFSFETGANSETQHYSIFSPGEDSYKDTKYPGDWSGQLYYFELWVTHLLRELTASNKWERLEKEIAGIKINEDGDEGKFSAQEYEELKLKIETLKRDISDIGMTSEQVMAIQNKLDHLIEMAKDMNKFDWKGLFIGSLLSIVVQLGVTPDTTKNLWAIIKQIFSNYLLP